MKKYTGMLVILAVVFVFAQGCSRDTKDDLKELGNDMKRDMNDAARKIDNKVEDALD